MGHRFEGGAGYLCPATGEAEARNHPASIGRPVRSPETRQRRHDDHFAAVLDRAGQPLGLCGTGDQPQLVAQILHEAARDEAGAFDCIGAPTVLLVEHRPEQAVVRMRDVLALVGQHECAGAIGRLGVPESQAPLPDRGGLLVAGEAAYRDRRAEPLSIALRQPAVRIDHPGKRRARHPEQFAQILVELVSVEREQQRSTCIARVGKMRSARQFVDQPAFDRAEGEGSGPRRRPHRIFVVEHPAHLRAREIGVEQQSGALLDLRLVPVVLHVGAEFRRTPVLPDDGASERFARIPIPGNDRFALVGDADGGDVARSLADDLARARQGLFPYLARVVLDPAGFGIMLRQVRLRDRFHPPVGGEDHRPGRGGPGI